ncbi:MAG: hypothetical protein ACR2M6_02320 [Vampirovibrionia bacterium]
MKCQILPNEIIDNILQFCDCELLIQLLGDNHFSHFHKGIRFNLDNRALTYWNSIQLNYVEKIMKPMMEQHMMNVFFAGSKYEMNNTRSNFLNEWHESDIKIYSSLESTRIDTVLSLINHEKQCLKEKYADMEELDGRPYIFNRYLMASLFHIAS